MWKEKDQCDHEAGKYHQVYVTRLEKDEKD